MFKNDWHSSTEFNYHETHNIYPNLNSVPLNAILLNDRQQFRLEKSIKLKIILLLRLKKEN